MSIRSLGSLSRFARRGIFRVCVQAPAHSSAGIPSPASLWPAAGKEARALYASWMKPHFYFDGSRRPHDRMPPVPAILVFTTFSACFMMSEEAHAGRETNGHAADDENKDDDLQESVDWVEKLPKSVNWVEKGAVTKPRDQGECGACWAYAGVAAVESLHQIKWGKLVNLSVQQVIDCAVRRVGTEDIEGKGCEGGLLYQAFEYVKKYGLTTEKAYPKRWLLLQGRCCALGKPVTSHINGYYNSAPSEASLMAAVARQPIAVEVDTCDLKGPFKGIIEIDDCPPATEENRIAKHCVLVVGYGTDEEGNKFWLIKNSWGSEWGENGYARLRRGTGNPLGVGGITRNYGYYPVLEYK